LIDGEESLDNKVKQFIESEKVTNTVKKTKCDLNLWYRWCQRVNEVRKEDIPVVELNRLLSHFYMTVKSRSGMNQAVNIYKGALTGICEIQVAR
jgi:hypothetical protein